MQELTIQKREGSINLSDKLTKYVTDNELMTQNFNSPFVSLFASPFERPNASAAIPLQPVSAKASVGKWQGYRTHTGSGFLQAS